MDRVDGDRSLPTLVSDLHATVRSLESELDPRRSGSGVGLPRPSTLLGFTTEVGIPAAMLVLRANLEALELLQRTLRMAEGRASHREERASPVGAGTRELGEEVLEALDGALREVEAAIEGRPENQTARDLLVEARALRTEVADRLAATGSGAPRAAEGREDSDDGDRSGAERHGQDVSTVDVEGELETIKEELDTSEGPTPRSAGEDEDAEASRREDAGGPAESADGPNPADADE